MRSDRSSIDTMHFAGGPGKAPATGILSTTMTQIILHRHLAFSALLMIVAWGISLSLPAHAQKSTERIAAVVNDQPISFFDLENRLKFTILTAGLPDNPEVRSRLTPDVLHGLIDDRLKLQEAKRLGVKVEPEAVEGAVRRMESQANMESGGMKDYLAKSGVPLGAMTDR
ncbi:MAG: hypothetical protein FJX42_05100, partial [Alphaproteobacteria bacterium]|nr:hypothetical protein [Alphaproteobacteria bacterium]